MITTTLAELINNGIVEEDDVDPGIFDSYVVADGYALHAELEENTWGNVSLIQRVLDEPGKEEDLIFVDEDGNSTNIGTDTTTVRIFKEITSLDQV